jgi:hypothetical protein
MLFNITKKRRTYYLIKECLIYIPFLICVVLWVFFATSYFQGFWMNEGMKKLLLEKEMPNTEVYRNFETIKTVREFYDVNLF